MQVEVVTVAELPERVRALALPGGCVVVNQREKRRRRKKKRVSL